MSARRTPYILRYYLDTYMPNIYIPIYIDAVDDGNMQLKGLFSQLSVSISA